MRASLSSGFVVVMVALGVNSKGYEGWEILARVTGDLGVRNLRIGFEVRDLNRG